MLKNNFVKALVISMALISSQAHAMALDWSGGYRFEWTEVDKPSLSSPSERKAYGLNYLYLSPKIIASDGVDVVSRFDILNSTSGTQLGEIWGMNHSASTAASNNQGEAKISVSQLYLKASQEYGALLVGRAPLDFGLGMAYNSGKGAFDHWYDSRDLIAYKVVVGDWFFMPILSRSQAKGYQQGDTISSMAMQLQYENADNRSLLGVIMETKKGSNGALGYTTDQANAFGGTASGSLSTSMTHFVLGRGFDGFEFKVEGGFLSGETGVRTATQDISYSSYGIAAELNFPRPDSKWEFGAKFGMATGDNPDTSNFEGFAFDQNYDVAMLLFNHRMGQKDFLNTNIYRPTNTGSATQDISNVGNSPDDEYLSNAVYLAPSVNYRWNDRFEIRNTLVYAQLMQTVKSSVASSKDLGLEWDIEATYKPSERVQWVNQLGLLFPGEAWNNGQNLGNGFNFGFASKAAISF